MEKNEKNVTRVCRHCGKEFIITGYLDEYTYKLYDIDGSRKVVYAHSYTCYNRLKEKGYKRL